ncbi:hypothetical protein Hanom_Chr00s000098g01620201 [Helianthus anomalus]
MKPSAYVDGTKDTDKCRQTAILIGEGIVSRVNEDNVVTSYTVVRVEELNSPSNYLSLDMYSSETGEWIDYRLPCLNLDPKSCRLIMFQADRDAGLYRLCDGCQGMLRFFQVAPDASSFYCFIMWDLIDYEKGEWCSIFTVTCSGLSSTDPELKSWLMKATFLPLYHLFDLDIVYMGCVELSSHPITTLINYHH